MTKNLNKDQTKVKRLSKSRRIHNRRVKQEARKVSYTPIPQGRLFWAA